MKEGSTICVCAYTVCSARASHNFDFHCMSLFMPLLLKIWFSFIFWPVQLGFSDVIRKYKSINFVIYIATIDTPILRDCVIQIFIRIGLFILCYDFVVIISSPFLSYLQYRRGSDESQKYTLWYLGMVIIYFPSNNFQMNFFKNFGCCIFFTWIGAPTTVVIGCRFGNQPKLYCKHPRPLKCIGTVYV